MRTYLRAHVTEVLVRAAGVTGAYARRLHSQATIVLFHRVNDQLGSDGLTCSSAKFEAFCEFFSRHFRVVPLSGLLASCRAGENVGGTLVITFDDGYRDNAEIEAPILRKLRLPVTLFVTTGFIGSHIVPPWDAHLPRQPGWMSWDQVSSLAAMGFEIGNHTATHLNLARADPEAIRADVALSQHRLAEELGTAGELFAYLSADPSTSHHARELVREAGFACCMACHGGVNPAMPDPFDLNRIGIGEWLQTPDQFGFELVTGRA
jgi:peptidoglycan/xylan/chitin deacetylase (PgdA/CDA1 family)